MLTKEEIDMIKGTYKDEYECSAHYFDEDTGEPQCDGCVINENWGYIKDNYEIPFKGVCLECEDVIEYFKALGVKPSFIERFNERVRS
jgi:hypothetical protein